jgi:acetyl esterase/lipase
MGESAGGGLAACLVHWTMVRLLFIRRHSTALVNIESDSWKYPDGPKFCKQILIYPMLDARNITPNEFTGQQYWSHADNKAGWKALLGETFGNPSLPVTSAAGRMSTEQAKGLPSIYIDVGEKDIFRDECIDYCSKLAKAGVSIELHVLPDLGHGFDGLNAGEPAVEAVVEARYRAIRSI